jgi:CheY-like chemotaxis protein
MSEGKGKSLFDPFYSAAGDTWRQDGHPLTSFQAIGQNIPDQAASLINQFSSPNPGWYATLFLIPGLQSTVWNHNPKLAMLEQMVVSLLPPVHNGSILVLPDNHLLLILQHIHGEQLSLIAQQLIAQLQPVKTPEPAKFETLNLSHINPKFLAFCEGLSRLSAAVQPVEPAVAPQTLAQKTTFLLDDNQLRLRKDRTTFRVLIIEDDPTTSTLLSHLISTKGEIAVAHDALQGATIYQTLVPNVVFLDIGLPDVDGLTLAHRIKAADPFAFVVMITANASKSNLETALTAGAKGFIAKPFNRERIQYYLTQAHQQKYE